MLINSPIFFLSLSGLLYNHVAGNMNDGGEYKLANSNAFETNYKDREYFDVYSKKITSHYSEVHWREHGPINLPEKIIERFSDGGLMAITGYEVDQVMKTESGDEVNVPISWAYNHHYGAWLLNSKKAKLLKKKANADAIKLGLNHGSEEHLVTEVFGVDETLDDSDTEIIPQSQLFSEGNGGEMRMSYHGYPSGYAQVIESPDTFHVIPMQIDTWNRNMKNATYIPGPLPRNSRIPQEAGYNRLLECPCSDRLPIEWGMTYTFADTEKCAGPIQDADECFSAVKQVIKSEKYNETSVSDNSLPSGCSSILNSDGHVDSIWNSAASPTSAGSEVEDDNPKSLIGNALGVVNLTIAIDESNVENAVELKLTGPADKWFGVGFGSSNMCIHMEGDECPDGGPYAIIVSGDTVTERKLDYHGPGISISKSLTVESNQVRNGMRTIHLSRPMKGSTKNHYSFDFAVASIPLIMAKGCDLVFAQHCGHGPNEVNLLPVDTSKKLCQAGIEGTIDGNEFNSERCAPFPYSDLLDQQNPTCFVQTYKGGLSCCRDKKYLLDKDQEIPWQDQPLEYYLKFRFYFEEFKKPTHPQMSPSHHQLVRLYWQTESHAGEYDIVPCREGVPPSECVQVITSRWKVRDMLHDCVVHDDGWCTGKDSKDPAKTEGVKLIYAGPHCHAATCLSMELYNADTGRLLCRMEPTFGQGQKGKYDEHGYLAIPPCLWGDAAEGLLEPELLSLDTNLLSIKRNNNTFPHTGEMASWQMRGIVIQKEETEEFNEPAMAQPLLRSWKLTQENRRDDEISN